GLWRAAAVHGVSGPAVGSDVPMFAAVGAAGRAGAAGVRPDAGTADRRCAAGGRGAAWTGAGADRDRGGDSDLGGAAGGARAEYGVAVGGAAVCVRAKGAGGQGAAHDEHDREDAVHELRDTDGERAGGAEPV